MSGLRLLLKTADLLESLLPETLLFPGFGPGKRYVVLNTGVLRPKWRVGGGSRQCGAGMYLPNMKGGFALDKVKGLGFRVWGWLRAPVQSRKPINRQTYRVLLPEARTNKQGVISRILKNPQ